MSYIPLPASRPRDAKHDSAQHPTYKKLIRTFICGAMFAVPLCVTIPNSPLLRLSQSESNKKSLIPRMMTDFLYVNFFASTVSYFFISERYITNQKALEGFMPYLGPLTAQVPGFSCLVVSHLFYPGMWAVFNELTWRERRREFVRLNTKCFFAFASVHVPVIVGLSALVGTFLYPYKLFKIYGEKKEQAATHSTRLH
ncbi:hypothetical protein STCU_00771 [Strigomonas culicis]|uniref:Uncharacterized protein n=1 Tax=Strigomonas culicis TaxID=28005 RepID=S9VF55_9TRYP|nr:hypothetical protein STCU_06587 [Strigomonas culicis]EPY36068.1 hypothetical protein STCU_00771 [Strigomonas culicis]|eukprot:EPY25656.1 hypothetical protein STCU_06587 [Strigomonas culicis]